MVLKPPPTPPIFQREPSTLVQLFKMDRVELRASHGDPFAWRQDFGVYVFNGLGGVGKATVWLSKYTPIFDLIHLDSIPRRGVATHKLNGSTMLWWKALETTFITMTCIWEAFVEAFCFRFMLSAWVDLLMNKFVNLKLNDIIVTEYITKFYDLLGYVPLFLDTSEARKDMLINDTNNCAKEKLYVLSILLWILLLA